MIYIVTSGDDYRAISRKVYGSEQHASIISTANPGIDEPLSSGAKINVPVLAGRPQDSISSQNVGESEVSLLVDGKRFRFWSSLRIRRALDVVDSAEFTAPFDSHLQSFRDTFKPFSYKPVTVIVGGQPLFTGTMVAITPRVEANQKTISVSCYSLPGVLGDCNPPLNTDNLEFDGQSLKQIAESMCAPFGVSVDFKGLDHDAAFDRVACSPTKKVLDFIASLAKQRNYVASSTERGELVIYRPGSSELVARLSQGFSPLLSIKPLFDPQQYYSHITAIETVNPGLPPNQYTVPNDRLQGVTRPFNFASADTKNADAKISAESKTGRMFANVCSYTAELSTWRDSKGNLWRPNTMVSVNAADAMIYADYKFMVSSVDFYRDHDRETCTLNLILPGAMSGQIPEVLPWG